MDIKRKKVGLALGSGGIRGFAHIGVIKTLIQHHIPIDAIAGVSVGSLIGGLYLSLGSIEKVETFTLSISYWELASLVSDLTWSTGFIRGEKIHEFLEQQNHDVTIESLSIPFAAVATDTRSGTVVPIRTGNLSTAIIASSAVPTVVSAVTMGDYQLVDGGISDPVPIDILKTLGADISIGVNLDAGFFPIKISEQDDKNNPFSTGMTMFDSLRYHLAKRSVIGSDIIIEPKLPKTSFKEIEQGKAFIERGVEATEKIIPELQKLLTQEAV